MRFVAFAMAAVMLTGTAACGARDKIMTKSYPAEQFFRGEALAFARAIKAEDVGEIQRLANLVDVNRPGNEDMTLLYYAMQERKYKAIHALMQLGADEEQEVPDIGQPISMAVRMKEPKVLKAILDGGGNPNAKSKHGTPILEEAAEDDNLESLKLLLDKGANPNAKDSLGQTPIYYPNRISNFDAVKMLIDRGAEIDVVDKNGVTFAWSVHNRFQDQQHGLPEQLRKITDIREHMIRRGISFPPDPPQVVRQKLGIPE
jgi:uncharacterized protein